MNTKTISALCMALACSMVSAGPQEAAGTEAMPQPHTENGITYLCGGVGSDEAAQMKRAAKEYDLMLTFATKGGNFLSDVAVDIADARGRSLLNTKCDGPIMLVDLPRQGRYHVRGEIGGRTVTGVALLRPGTKGKPLHLVLPSADEAPG